MAIRVGRWDCPVCQTNGILGPEKHCTNCGSPRPQNVKFYLVDESEVVQDEKRLKEAKDGADWVCSYCNAHNKVSDTQCHSCGNDREIKDGDKSLQEKITYTDGRNQPELIPSYNKSTNVLKKPKINKKLKFGCLGTIATVVLLFILSLFTSEIEVSVDSFAWERSIKIEKYIQVTENDWNFPNGGKLVRSYQDIHHYNEVPDGTETKTRTVQEQTGTKRVKVGTRDLGNGYIEDVYEDQPVYTDKQETYTETKYKKVPVYQTKYEYTIFRWKDAGEFKTSNKDNNPYWSEQTHAGEENFREKSRSEKYYVFVKDDSGEKHKAELSFDKWSKLKPGDKLKAEISTVFRNFIGLK